MAPEFLSAEFFCPHSAREHNQEMLDALGAVLREQTSYARTASLAEAAQLFRSAYASGFQAETGIPPETSLSDQEIQNAIKSVVDDLKGRTARLYVEKKKLTPQELEAHCAALRRILGEEFSKLGWRSVVVF